MRQCLKICNFFLLEASLIRDSRQCADVVDVSEPDVLVVPVRLLRPVPTTSDEGRHVDDLEEVRPGNNIYSSEQRKPEKNPRL